MTSRNRKATIAIIPAVLALLAPAILLSPTHAGVKNMMHKHPVATGVVAGMAAHHMAKHAHHGIMHRHPKMTGLAAGMAAHHMAKKH